MNFWLGRKFYAVHIESGTTIETCFVAWFSSLHSLAEFVFPSVQLKLLVFSPIFFEILVD